MASDDTPSSPPGSPPGSADREDDTRILRRIPLSTGAQPVVSPSTGSSDSAGLADEDAPATSIIRRTPTGSLPVATDDAPTGLIRPARPAPRATAPSATPSATAAIATAVASILSGWATGVIATDLITGWWGTDPLFCVAMAFLTAIAGAATISGLIALLLRRRTARLLIVVGAVVALLIFAGLFVAGATLPPAVYAMPLLPLVSIGLVALPATARWSRSG